jgi:hypothetical protein
VELQTDPDRDSVSGESTEADLEIAMRGYLLTMPCVSYKTDMFVYLPFVHKDLQTTYDPAQQNTANESSLVVRDKSLDSA